MDARSISVGMRLRLKPARADAYGFPRDARIIVTEVRHKNGYKTPWIVSNDLSFRPSDFAKSC